MAKVADVNTTLDALMQKINNKAKHRVIARAEDVPNVFFLRRPSGIMQLDIDTGGGLPAGGWCFISGPDGGGKSTLLYKYFEQQQLLYGDACCIGLALTEFAPDHFYMRSLGVKIAIPDRAIEEKNEWRKSRGLLPFTKEEIKELKVQVGRFDIVRGATGEEALEATLELYRTKAYNIIGVDSISALLPEVDVDKSLDAHNARAASANLQTKFAKKFHPLTLGLDNEVNETTLIMINQVRANSSKSEAPTHIQKYLPDWAATGAYAMRHGKLIDITIWTGPKVKEGEKEARIQTGKMLKWEITKGKAGTHDGITGEVEFDFLEHFQDGYLAFLAGFQSGVVVEGRAGFDVIQKDTKRKLAVSLSKKGLIEKLTTDYAFQVQVRMEVLAARGISCRYF